MKYQDNFLSQQYNDLFQKLISVSTSLDIKAIEDADTALSLFEQIQLREPMNFDNRHDELSVLQIIKNNVEKTFDPIYFYFENGKLRRPALNDDERELVTHYLTPRMGGFTGRVGIHNWSTVDINKLIKNTVTVSIERK